MLKFYFHNKDSSSPKVRPPGLPTNSQAVHWIENGLGEDVTNGWKIHPKES